MAHTVSRPQATLPPLAIAFHARLAGEPLGQAYSLGYLICGVAALAAALLAAAALTASRTARWSPRNPWLTDGAGLPAQAPAAAAGWPGGGNRPGPQDAVMYVVPHNQ